MDIEQKIKTKLLIRGFSKKTLLNNRGLIGATTDETILEVVKNLGIFNVRNERELLLSFMEYRDKLYWGENEHTKNEEIIDLWLKKSIVANEQV
jgi:uncharacterized protein YjaZ